MISQKTKQTKPHNQTEPLTIKHVDVTELDSEQRYNLFIDCMSKNGFVGFVKRQESNQTCFIFTYRSPMWA